MILSEIKYFLGKLLVLLRNQVLLSVSIMQFADAIISFLESYQIQNFSPFTLKGYSGDLRNFLRFAQDIKGEAVLTDDIALSDLHSFRIKQLREGIQINTINHKLAAIRSFAVFCEKNEIPFIDPRKIDFGKKEVKPIVVLDQQELSRLLHAADISKIGGLRDRAIFELLACSGIRVGELLAIDKTDLDFTQNQFQVIGKGRKRRTCFFTMRTAVWLRLWIQKRKDRFPALFTSLAGNYSREGIVEDLGRLSAVAVQAMIRKYAEKAGLRKQVTTHTFRHTWATSLLQSGCDIRSLQELLGHSSLITTQVYLHLVPSQLKKAYGKCFDFPIVKEQGAK